MFGVQYLKQSRRRVSMKIVGQFIDLIQHEHRVVRFDAPNGLKNTSRHGTDVSAPVPANFGFVAHAAQ